MEIIYTKADKPGTRFALENETKEKAQAPTSLGSEMWAFFEVHAALMKKLAEPIPLVKEKEEI